MILNMLCLACMFNRPCVAGAVLQHVGMIAADSVAVLFELDGQWE